MQPHESTAGSKLVLCQPCSDVGAPHTRKHTIVLLNLYHKICLPLGIPTQEDIMFSRAHERGNNVPSDFWDVTDAIVLSPLLSLKLTGGCISMPLSHLLRWLLYNIALSLLAKCEWLRSDCTEV